MAKSGYTRLPHEILETITLAKLTGAEYQILLVIIRRTLGFRKEEAAISLSYFKELTGLSIQGINKAKRRIEARNIISASRYKGKKTVYGMKNPLEWTSTQPLPSESHKLVNERSLALGNQREPNQATTVAQTSTLSTKGRTIAKDTLKHTLKDNGIKESNPSRVSPSLDDGLTTPPLAGRSGKDRVLDYLRSHGRCGLGQLSDALTIRYISVQCYLNILKRAGLVTNPQRGKWEAVGV